MKKYWRQLIFLLTESPRTQLNQNTYVFTLGQISESGENHGSKDGFEIYIH